MSAEINLFLAAFQTTVGDIDILITSLNGIPFQTGGHKGHSARVKRMLSAKLFQGPLYKGSARQCSSVMWFLWYAIQKLLIGRGILVKEIPSFSAAMDVCRTLDRFTYSTEVVQNEIQLYLHQVDRHQALFNVAYPDDWPKHHARYHVVDALRLLGKSLCQVAHTQTWCLLTAFWEESDTIGFNAVALRLKPSNAYSSTWEKTSTQHRYIVNSKVSLVIPPWWYQLDGGDITTLQ